MESAQAFIGLSLRGYDGTPPPPPLTVPLLATKLHTHAQTQPTRALPKTMSN